MVMAPTVMAPGTRAGEKSQALRLLLPAATTMVTPLAMAPATAASREAEVEPPRDILATAGRSGLLATKSMPAITPLQEPEPAQSSTRTGIRATPLATPRVV